MTNVIIAWILSIFLAVPIVSVDAQYECMNVSNLLSPEQMNHVIDNTFKSLVKAAECKMKKGSENPADSQMPIDLIKVPPRPRKFPLTVNISFYIEQLSQVFDEEMTFRIDFYVMQKWTAQRNYCNLYKKQLNERKIQLADYNSSDDMLQMNSDYFELFWLPDTYISNSKVYVVPNTKDNGGDDKPGQVCKMMLSGRFAAIMPCFMDFRNYPVDKQTCNITMKSCQCQVCLSVVLRNPRPIARARQSIHVSLLPSSCPDATVSFPVDEVILDWEEMPDIDLIQLPQHTSRIYSSKSIFVTPAMKRLDNQSIDSLEEQSVLLLFDGPDKYSNLVITLVLSRDISNKLAGVYIPTALIVLVCLSTFWYGPRSISDRITVGITALLAIITQFIDTRKYIPPISYISLMDIWIIVCMVFVCIQLVQGTFVHYFYLRAKRDARRKQQRRIQELKDQLKHDQGLSQTNRNWLQPVTYTPPSALQLAITNASDRIMSTNQSDNSSKADNHVNRSQKSDDQHPSKKSLFNQFWSTSYGKMYWKVFGTNVPPTSSAYIPELIDTHSRVWILFAFFLFCFIYAVNVILLISDNDLN